MKTAKQWVDEVVNGPGDKMDPEEFVSMVLLDGWKQGMTDAIKAVHNCPKYGGQYYLVDAIKAAKKAKTSV